MKHFAIDIRLKQDWFRFATERMALNEPTQGCGSDVFLPYLPKIVSVDPVEQEVELEGSSPLPSIKVSIHDVDRRLVKILNEGFAEEASAIVRMLEDGEEKDRVVGFITDNDWKEGVITFTVRTDEDIESDDKFKLFSFDSFQHMEILSPVRVEVGVDVQVNNSTPWRVFKSVIRRDSIIKQEFTFVGGSLINSYYNYTATSKFEARAKAVLPEASVVKLATYTNQYSLIQPDTDPIDSDWMGGSPTARKYLKEYVSSNPLFGNVTETPTNYAYAIIGNSETGQQEIFAYAYCLKGKAWVPNRGPGFGNTPGFLTMTGAAANNYYLSGIPHALFHDPLGIFGTPAEKAAFAAEFKIKNTHAPGEIIAPSVAVDELYIDAGGLIPRFDNDPDLSVGLLWAGRTITLDNAHGLGEDMGNAFGRTVKAFSRYHIAAIYEDIYDDVNDTGVIPYVLKVEIHNRPLSPRHYYAINFRSGFPIYELPAEVSQDTKLLVARFDYALLHMDIPLNNIEDSVYSRLLTDLQAGNPPVKLTNRYKGSRVDSIKDFHNLLVTVSSNRVDSATYDPDNIEEVNDAVVNNATERFAICTRSEFFIDGGEVLERLYFPVRGGSVYAYNEGRSLGSNQYIRRRIGFISDPDVFADDTIGDNYLTSAPSDSSAWVNMMVVSPGAVSLEDWNNNGFEQWENEAKAFFSLQRYRIIHDPVPENSSDLGKMFPIVFGRVYRVPMLQVISRKVMLADESTAGDDVYVFASHRTDVKSARDIRLEWFPDDPPNGMQNEELFDPAMQREIVESPFPFKKSGHYVVEEVDDKFQLKFVGDINTPYHRVISARTLDGFPLSAVKLTGDEWDERAGRSDKRYPIRNGLGTTPLYATFSGYIDEQNRLVHHPADVIREFIKLYGLPAMKDDFIDENSFKLVKSQTPRYTASIFLNEPIKTSEFLEKICDEFGFMYFITSGRLKLIVPDIRFVDYSKPLSEGFNLIEGMVEKSEGYKQITNQIRYEYRKNWVTDSYDKLIVLNASNNAECAKATLVKGQKKEKSVKADFVRSSLVAKEVSMRYARLLAGKRRKLSCSARYVDGIVFSPGDIIPVTYSDFDLDGELAIVTKVTVGRLVMDLELFILGGLNDIDY